MKGQLSFNFAQPAKASILLAEDGVDASAGESRIELPEGWEWQHLGEVIADIQSGFACGIKDVPDGLPQLRMNNIKTSGGLDLSLVRRIPPNYINPQKYLLRPGDVLFNNTNSVELVGKTVLFDINDGEWVYSNHLTRLRPQPDLVLSEWLVWVLRALWQQKYFENICTRWVGQSAVSQDKIKGIPIPLPPLSEQHRIVEWIEAFAQRAEETLEHINRLEQDFDALCRSLIFSDSDGDPVATPMSELVSLRAPDVTVKPDEIYAFAGLKSFGRGVFKGPVKSGAEFAYPRLTRLHAGEFVYPKLMAWEGAFGIVPLECEGLVVSTEFPVFEVNQERVLPETLDVYFRTPSVWPMISEISTGTNARRKRLHPSAFLAYEIPLPPMKTQLRLREMKHRVDELRQRHTLQRQELEKLLPAVLDRAFRGEL